MSPEKKVLGIAVLSLVSAVTGGYDVIANVVPARNAIIRDIGCSDLGLSYSGLLNRSEELSRASRILDEPIRNPNSRRIIDCMTAVREIANSQGLNSFGFREGLGSLAFVLGGLSFFGYGAAFLTLRKVKTF